RRRVQAVDGLMRGLSFTLKGDYPATLRAALSGADEALRESVIEQMRDTLPQGIAETLIDAFRETRSKETTLSTLTEVLLARLQSVDPYIRAVAMYALGQRGAVTREVLETMIKDEHAIVSETARCLYDR